MKNTELKQLRLKAKLTQKQAADLIDVSTRRWQKWEAGDHKMSKALLDYFVLKLQLLEKEK